MGLNPIARKFAEEAKRGSDACALFHFLFTLRAPGQNVIIV